MAFAFYPKLAEFVIWQAKQRKMNHRKLILYISSSLDGYIAAPGDDLSFLNRVQQAGADYGYYDFIANVRGRIGAAALRYS